MRVMAVLVLPLLPILALAVSQPAAPPPLPHAQTWPPTEGTNTLALKCQPGAPLASDTVCVVRFGDVMNLIDMNEHHWARAEALAARVRELEAQGPKCGTLELVPKPKGTRGA